MLAPRLYKHISSARRKFLLFILRVLKFVNNTDKVYGKGALTVELTFSQKRKQLYEMAVL